MEDGYTQKYTQDKVMVIDDWRLTKDAQVYPYFNTPMDLMHDGRWGNVVTVNGRIDEKLEVHPGERVRLRMINTSNARIYKPQLDGLSAKVIAVDGMYVKKVFDLGDLELSPGNRIDLDVKVPKDAANKTFQIYDNFTGARIALFDIIVSGDVVKVPNFEYPDNPKVPNWVGADNLSVDKEYRLNARIRPASKKNKISGMGMGQIEWTINWKAYPEYDPVKLKFGKFNLIRFTNESSRLHPMHLHGQFFKVVARDGKPAKEDFFRDTVLVYPKQVVDIALVPLDKGHWVSHCHILEHAESGMMTVVNVI